MYIYYISFQTNFFCHNKQHQTIYFCQMLRLKSIKILKKRMWICLQVLNNSLPFNINWVFNSLIDSDYVTQYSIFIFRPISSHIFYQKPMFLYSTMQFSWTRYAIRLGLLQRHMKCTWHVITKKKQNPKSTATPKHYSSPVTQREICKR